MRVSHGAPVLCCFSGLFFSALSVAFCYFSTAAAAMFRLQKPLLRLPGCCWCRDCEGLAFTLRHSHSQLRAPFRGCRACHASVAAGSVIVSSDSKSRFACLLWDPALDAI